MDIGSDDAQAYLVCHSSPFTRFFVLILPYCNAGTAILDFTPQKPKQRLGLDLKRSVLRVVP